MTLLFALTLAGCGTSARPDDTSGAIRVYVYFVNQGTHEPVAGAIVHVVGADGCVVRSVKTDSDGVATLPAGFDVTPAKYLFAETEDFLITGVRWSHGRREYNLPLQLEPAVNRITVP